MLRDRGLVELADAYVTYYRSAWRFFLSGYSDTDAGRSAIEAGSQVLAEGAELGRRWLEEDQRLATTT